MVGAGKAIQIVFVSSDRDEAQFQEYFETMPWLALPFGERDLKQTLSSKYGVNGIPKLVLLDGETCKVITGDGRNVIAEITRGNISLGRISAKILMKENVISRDNTGEHFPWEHFCQDSDEGAK
eukprot:CAMPEP_0179463624 /NCGR_PEP_ID=MMETSP0799-20121207/45644_1 /TAXON_ID=46947 /ORGANISM="Geminigera cryophila, Strain CCMP2564" /LENGTH=123 /DNA_ID=CAMNT_0021267001 /DNA_START=159 /DNA_END=528 /DNA_ORIENTATION=+